jgi:hypothetical protein
MHERHLNEGQWKYRKQWSLGAGQRRNTFWNRYTYILCQWLANRCHPQAHFLQPRVNRSITGYSEHVTLKLQCKRVPLSEDMYKQVHHKHEYLEQVPF